MPHLQAEAVEVMTEAFRRLESALPQPERVQHRNSFVFRYANKGIREALLQKLARSISGLNAVSVLLNAGYFQEVGVMFRTLDEIREDILFLAIAETSGAKTERHTQYLEAFYAEAVFSRPEGSMEVPKPNRVPGKKIRAKTMNTIGRGINVSQALAASESVGTVYSGYVHAASEIVMDMYGGSPPRFQLEGMRGTTHVAAYCRDAEIYVHRGLLAAIAVAKAFDEASLVSAMYKFIDQYELTNGHKSQSSGGDT